MKRATETELNEAELHLRTFLHLLIMDAKRVLAVLDGKMPVVDIKSSQAVIPEPEMPKGNRVKFKRRTFSKDEVDFLLSEGLRPLQQMASAATIAFVKTMWLRRFGR